MEAERLPSISHCWLSSRYKDESQLFAALAQNDSSDAKGPFWQKKKKKTHTHTQTHIDLNSPLPSLTENGYTERSVN